MGKGAFAPFFVCISFHKTPLLANRFGCKKHDLTAKAYKSTAKALFYKETAFLANRFGCKKHDLTAKAYKTYVEWEDRAFCAKDGSQNQMRNIMSP